MRAAIVQNGEVQNIILADDPIEFGALPVPDEVDVGWLKINDTFVPPAVEPQPDPEPIDPLTLPLDRVRFEFLRDKLDRDKPGFIAAAEALFDNLPEDTPAEVDFKLLAKVLWRTGQEFYIHHGLFALAVHEGIITQQELEDAWRAGVVLSW